MDVAPPWYDDWERTSCGGESRRCGGGDKACAEAAEKEGYVRVSLYTFCRKESVHSEPGVATYMTASVVTVVALVLGFVFSRRVRKRGETVKPDPAT